MALRLLQQTSRGLYGYFSPGVRIASFIQDGMLLTMKVVLVEVTDMADISVRDLDDDRNIAVVFHERFAELGGVDLDIPPRTDLNRPATAANIGEIGRGGGI